MPVRCRGIWSKLEAYVPRFALILSRLRLALDPEQTEQLTAPVLLEDVKGAIRLGTYFKAAALRIQHRATGGTLDPDAKAIIGWIDRNKITTFRARDVRRVLSDRFPTQESASRPLRSLAHVGVIRPKTEQIDPQRGGRRPTRAYEVHPDLRDSLRSHRETDKTDKTPV